MYDELIKNLRGMAKGFCPFDIGNKMCGYFVTQEAADAIEELQGKTKVLEKLADHWCNKVPKWIPVTERLPEKDQTVLAYCAEDNFCYISRMHQSFEDYDVTHWIPLPQMPEREET